MRKNYCKKFFILPPPTTYEIHAVTKTTYNEIKFKKDFRYENGNSNIFQKILERYFGIFNQKVEKIQNYN